MKKKFIIIPLLVIILIFIFYGTAFYQQKKIHYNNVILITLDTLRQDVLGCYGNVTVKTPVLDELAQQGILFKNAYCNVPSTLPSHASMLFSETPWNLKVFRNGNIIDNLTFALPKYMKKAGFQTAAFTSLGVVESYFGLSQGFDYYFDVSHNQSRSYLFADEVNKEVFKWLSSHYQKSFFAWIHYSDPHEPYIPKYAPPDVELTFNDNVIARYNFIINEFNTINLSLKPGNNTLTFNGLRKTSSPSKKLQAEYFLEKFMLKDPSCKAYPAGSYEKRDTVIQFTTSLTMVIENPSQQTINTQIIFRGNATQNLPEAKRHYYDEVEYLDKELGNLINWLKAYNSYQNTLILIIADHGEGLGNHNIMGHENHLYFAQIKIPFIIIDHSHKAKVIESLVSPMDLAPTISSYLHLKPDKNWRGNPVQPLLSKMNGYSPERKYLESATFFAKSNEPSYIFHKFSIVTKTHHLIYSLNQNKYELYNVSDKKEIFNLARYSLYPEDYDKLLSRLQHLEMQAEKQILTYRKTPLPPHMIEQLKSLGYLNP